MAMIWIADDVALDIAASTTSTSHNVHGNALKVIAQVPVILQLMYNALALREAYTN